MQKLLERRFQITLLFKDILNCWELHWILWNCTISQNKSGIQMNPVFPLIHQKLRLQEKMVFHLLELQVDQGVKIPQYCWLVVLLEERFHHLLYLKARVFGMNGQDKEVSSILEHHMKQQKRVGWKLRYSQITFNKHCSPILDQHDLFF